VTRAVSLGSPSEGSVDVDELKGGGQQVLGDLRGLAGVRLHGDLGQVIVQRHLHLGDDGVQGVDGLQGEHPVQWQDGGGVHAGERRNLFPETRSNVINRVCYARTFAYPVM